jgi:hypothetical protein
MLEYPLGTDARQYIEFLAGRGLEAGEVLAELNLTSDVEVVEKLEPDLRL